MNSFILEQLKKQGFTVVLLVGAVYGLFTYFTNEIHSLRLENKKTIYKLECKLENCQDKLIQEIKSNSALSLVKDNAEFKKLSSYYSPFKKRGRFERV